MKVYSVTQINNYLKRLLENDIFLREIYIEAEISNFKAHGSGHFYLTLKDSDAAISAVMFRTYASQLEFMPENGMKVLAGGYISIYEKTGQYQLYISSLEPAGRGALYAAFEKLKARLEKSGVFDPKYKKPIPSYPKCVAVITSATGAAIRDIINVSNRRNPNVEIVVVPTLVQGENAPKDIVDSIEMVNRWGKADTIIVGRGGGSIEDLWAFNEEIVARAIFNSNIPIISAVGHETDFTIADFISDLRAPTPSAAAELAIPESSSMTNNIEDIIRRLNNNINLKLSNYNYRLNIFKANRKIKYYSDEINNSQIYVDNIIESMNNRISKLLDFNNIKLKGIVSSIENMSPLNILSKGYSITYKGNSVVKSVEDLNNGDTISIRLKDGCVNGNIIK